MDKIIVYLDDAAHALQQLAPMTSGGAGATGTLWILVACPPHVTKHVSRWVTHSARENWRKNWCEEQFSRITPALKASGGSVMTLIAHGPLVQQTDRLLRRTNRHACWMPGANGLARTWSPSPATSQPRTPAAGACRARWLAWGRCWCWRRTDG